MTHLLTILFTNFLGHPSSATFPRVFSQETWPFSAFFKRHGGLILPFLKASISEGVGIAGAPLDSHEIRYKV